MKNVKATTDGPKRLQKEVEVTLLKKINNDFGDFNLWFTEYPKGILDIASSDDNESFTVYHDVPMDEMLGYMMDKPLAYLKKQANCLGLCLPNYFDL